MPGDDIKSDRFHGESSCGRIKSTRGHKSDLTSSPELHEAPSMCCKWIEMPKAEAQCAQNAWRQRTELRRHRCTELRVCNYFSTDQTFDLSYQSVSSFFSHVDRTRGDESLWLFAKFLRYLRAERSNTRRQSENSTRHVNRKIDELTTNLEIYIHFMKRPTSIRVVNCSDVGGPATRAHRGPIGELSGILQQSVPTNSVALQAQLCHRAQLDTVPRSLRIWSSSTYITKATGTSASSRWVRLFSEHFKVSSSSRLVWQRGDGKRWFQARHHAFPTLVSRLGHLKTSGRTVSLLMYPPLCKVSNSWESYL